MEVFDGGNAKSPRETNISNLYAKNYHNDASISGGVEKSLRDLFDETVLFG